MAYLDPKKIRELASRLGHKPTKQFGQNFVHDANTVRRIVELSGVQDNDRVLEIGPGLGSLTLGLLASGAEVTAVEIDPVLARQLSATVTELAPQSTSRLTVIEKDALKLESLATSPSAVVANLPYNVSVPVILHLLKQFPTWKYGLVMVQLEVAQRLAAQPGNKIYGVPSLKLSWWAEAKIVGTVPKNVFWPVPNVESGLVQIIRHRPLAEEELRHKTFALIDAAFAQRRKMLRQSLSGVLGSGSRASEVLQTAGIAETARGETLRISDFLRIAEVDLTK